MSLASPLFSVVIPAYNAERFIWLTLHSIFCQTEQDFEIVLVNDGSTDGTLQILENIRDERLRIITQENGGECVARNRGIQEARGKYIAFLDSDDCWRSNHLELVYSCIAMHPEVPWYVTHPIHVDDIHETDLLPTSMNNAHIITNWFLEVSGLPAASGTVLERQFALSVPDAFPPGIRMYGDNIGWDRLAMVNPQVCLLDAQTTLYRTWAGNASAMYNGITHGERSQAVSDAFDLYLQLWNHPKATPEARLYYRRLLTGNWWACISSALPPAVWQDCFRRWQTVVGGDCTIWMRLFCFVATIVMRLMRWGIRHKKQAIMRKMSRLAAKSHQRIENTLS